MENVNDEEKLIRVITKAVNRAEGISPYNGPWKSIIGTITKDGDIIRKITSIIAKAYVDNPESLKEYFSHKNLYIQGVSTGAYAMITGDLDPVIYRKFGGLGATLTKHNKLHVSLSDSQLWYSKNSNNSLEGVSISGNVLKKSINLDNALKDSQNSGNSLEASVNYGNALKNSRNKHNSLLNSHNLNDTLENSHNSGSSLYMSWNCDNSLRNSVNCHEALFRSYIYSNSLKYSENYDSALFGYIYDNDPLKHSKKFGDSCKPGRHIYEW